MKKLQEIIIYFKKKFKDNRSNSRRFRAFYNSTKEDKRNDLAKAIDYIFFRIIIFFSLFLIILFKYNHIYIAILTATIVLYVYHTISVAIRKKRLNELKKQKRWIIASQKIYKEILNKTVDEMEEYIITLLSKIGFSQIKNIDSQQKYLLLQSTYNFNKIMIGCYTYKNDFDVELKELKEFLCQLTQANITRGLLFTTSDFTQDCYNYLGQINENYNIILINKDKLLNIIESMGMYPTEAEIDEVIENQISKKNKNWIKYKTIAFSNKKIRGYFLLSIFLMVASLYMPYTMYYMIVSIISLFLTLITFIICLYGRQTQQDKLLDIKKLLEDL